MDKIIILVTGNESSSHSTSVTDSFPIFPTTGAYADQLMKLCFTVFTILVVAIMFTLAEVHKSGYSECVLSVALFPDSLFPYTQSHIHV